VSGRPAISVVVPFLGDAAAAGRLIEGLGRLTLSPDDEVIVVDNAAAAVVPDLPQGPVRIVRAAAEQSPFHARNVGAGAARNDWLLFMDADCRPAPDLLDAYFAGPQEGCGVIAGAVLPLAGQPGVVPRYARSRRQLSEAHHVVSRPEWPHPAGITGNLMVRREAWEEVGGFHEGLLAGADIELCWRVQDAGWAFRHVPEARVEHAHVESLRALMRQASGHAAGMRWVNRRHPGAFPRPTLARQLARCAAGTAVWALRGQGERSLFKLIDAAWVLAYALGYHAGDNRARRPSEAGVPGNRVDAVLLASEFPRNPSGPPEQGAEMHLDAGRKLRVEALARPRRPDRSLLARATVTYAEDDSPPARLRAILALVVRHPIRCARHVLSRGPEGQIPTLRVLAPPVLRCARTGAVVVPIDVRLASDPIVLALDGEHAVAERAPR
jgi:GT2 family glycosyltransferase